MSQSPSKKDAAAFCRIATDLLNVLVSGSTDESQRFWKTVLQPEMLLLFPLGTSADRISLENVGADDLLRRVCTLCGFEMDGDHNVTSITPRVKKLRIAADGFDASYATKKLKQLKIARDACNLQLARQQRISAHSSETLGIVEKLLRVECVGRSAVSFDTLSAVSGALATKWFGDPCVCGAQLLAQEGALRYTATLFKGAVVSLRQALSQLQSLGVDGYVVLPVVDMLIEVLASGGYHHDALKMCLLLEEVGSSQNGALNPLDVAMVKKRSAALHLTTSGSISFRRRARDLLLESYHLEVSLLGATHLIPIATMRKVADAHVALDEECEAIELLEKLIPIAAVHGEESVLVMSIRDQIAAAFLRMRNFAEARRLMMIILASRETFHPPEELVVSYLALEVYYTSQGSMSEAGHAIRVVLGKLEGQSYDNPLVLEATTREARHFHRMGKFGDALASWTKVLDARERQFGSLHPLCADVLFEIGVVLFEKQSFHESWHCFDVCRSIRTKLLGARHLLVPLSIAWCGRSDAAAGNRINAVVTFQEALDAIDSLLDESQPMIFPQLTAQVLCDIAVLLLNDAKSAIHDERTLDIHRIMLVGESVEAELRRARALFLRATTFCLQHVKNPRHVSVESIDALVSECDRIIAQLSERTDRLVAEGQRARMLQSWSHMDEDVKRQKDPLWYRKQHKVFKLK